MATGQPTPSIYDSATWRDMLARPDRGQAALTAAFLFASLLIVPLCTVTQAATLYLLATVCFYYMLVRSLPAMLGLGVPLLAVYGITSSFSLTAVVAAFLLGGACGAFLLIHYHDPRDLRHWGLLLLPALAYGAAALVTRDPVRGLLVLLPLAISVVFAICVLNYRAHTPSVVGGAAALVGALAVAFVVTLGVTGQLAGDPLGSLAGALRSSITQMLLEARTLYAEAGMELGLTDVDIANTAATTVNLLPAILLASTAVVSYLAWRALLRMMLSFGTLPRIPMRLGGFTMSAFSAALFVLTFVVALIANAEEATLFGTILQNIATVLEPGLALIGLGSLFARSRTRSCFTYILSFGLIFIIWSNPGVGLALAAFFGACNILMARFLPAPNEKGD